MAQSSSNGSSKRGLSSSPLNGSHSSPSHTEVGPLPYHWHDKQELILRELEETRARATQMEKTMRWWSDCTANWREKWSKVRSERNKAREEVRLLRCRLDAVQRETGTLRREKNDLENRLSFLANGPSTISDNFRNSSGEKTSPHRQQKLGIETHQSMYQDDSPERDCNEIVPNQRHKIESPSLSTDQLLEEMFGCSNIEEIAKGVENVSVFVHPAGEASKLSNKCKSDREGKLPTAEEYLQDTAEKELASLQDGIKMTIRENDIEEKLLNKLKHQNGDRPRNIDGTMVGSGSGNSSSQPSPSHRISALSDSLPEGCHISPRVSAVSDPLSEAYGTSECSETGYAESIRSSNEGLVGRRWRSGGGIISGVSSSILDDSGITPEQESLEQQVTMLKLRLDEATKTIQAERDEKNMLDRESTRWQAEVGELRSRLEDVRASRQEAVKELVALRALHQKEVQTLQLEMLDEASSRECIDRRLSDLRSELERLQEENAAEWGKRERLESEKLGLERENKKLKSQISDLEERLDKRNKMGNTTSESDVGALKDEIIDKNKELTELKHSHSKLKKVLSDKSVDLQHCNRRADQYESEVKRLRARVDELKKELAAAEDEVDSASNNIRKLQRSNDELQETVENLQVQVEHLQSRLRSSQATSLPLRTTVLLQDSDDEPTQY